MSALVAERGLDYLGGESVSEAFVRIYAPEDEGDSWRCAYHVSWPGFNRQSRSYGHDSWQALQLAMQIVPVEISATEDFKEGRLGVFGTPLRTNADLIDWLGLRPMKALEE
jgi:hypothetical protein